MPDEQNPYPNIIDNNHQKLGDLLKELFKEYDYAKIVSGYFYIGGFELVSECAQKTKADIVIGIKKTNKATKEEFKEYLKNIEKKKNKEEILSLAELMRKRREDDTKGIKFYMFKHPPHPPLHAKVYYFGLNQKKRSNTSINSSCIFGSSNFTPSGLGGEGENKGNIEFNAKISDISDSDHVLLNEIEKWFDDYIIPNSDDLNTNLLETIEEYEGRWSDENEGYKYVEPLKFVKLLIKYYNAENLLDSILLPHQINDYIAAKKSIEKYGGCIIASSVGLGKSYVASQLVKDYLYNEKDEKIGKALLIGRPEEVKEQWMTDSDSPEQGYLKQNGVNPRDVKYLSMYEFQKKEFNPEEYKDYDIIVIDEVHNFRNITTRHKNLLKTIEGIRKNNKDIKFITLTGTPINNTPTDLYNIIQIFFDEEKFTSGNLIESCRKLKEYESTYNKYKGCESCVDSMNLKNKLDDIKKKDVKKLISELMPRTTRLDLKEIYADMKLEINGKTITLKDPKLLEADKKYDMYKINQEHENNQNYKKIYEDIYEKKYENGGKKVTKLFDFIIKLNLPHLTIYNPFKQEKENRLPGLYKVQLYKRLESSIYSFYKSLDNLEEKDKKLSDILESESGLKEINRRLKESYYKIYSQDEVREIIDEEIEKIELTDDALKRYKEDTKQDLNAIKDFKESIEGLRINENDKKSFIDPKLDALKDFINSYKDKKILLFSQFKDTVDYLDDCIKDIPKVKITGSTNNKIEHLDRFKREENVKLLLSTDTLSEGVNIPEADIVVNYDLPWNPVRLIQRIGRVDRLNNEKDIWIKNFIPDEKFDEEIELVETLKKKIADIIELIGGEYPILEEGEIRTIKDIREIMRNSRFDELERAYSTTEKGDLYNLINFITKVIYKEMMRDRKSHDKIKEEIKKMTPPEEIFYTVLNSKNSKTKSIGFFYVIDEKNKLNKTSPLNYLRNINDDRVFPTDAEFSEYKYRLTNETKNQIKDFEDKKLIELRREYRGAKYSKINDKKHEIIKQIETEIKQPRINDNIETIKKLHSLLEKFGNKNIPINCEKYIENFYNKWTDKGKSTNDMNKNKDELYSELEELDTKIEREIGNIEEIGGKLKAFVIFENGT